MSSKQSVITPISKTKEFLNISNEFNLNAASLTIFPITYDTFIQISPDNNYIAFMRKNSLLEVLKKENGNWESDGELKITNFKKIKGINWSPDNRLILIYGIPNSENKSLIKIINRNDSLWNFELTSRDSISHASFYPDSKAIVYIKEPKNTLNIFYLYENKNKNTKNPEAETKNFKNKYLFMKFRDERCINYIINNNIILMILPVYGRTYLDKVNKIKQTNSFKDHLIILADTKIFRCFETNTHDLDRIFPVKNYLFIVIEKEFYIYPFYIYNLYGEVIYKSEFSKSSPRLLSNPCLLNNKYYETNFILVQEPEGKFEVLECDAGITRSKVYLYYEYNKLFDYIEKNKSKNNIFNNILSNEHRCNYMIYSNNFSAPNENYAKKEEIFFFEEINDISSKEKENIPNNMFNIKENIFSKRNKLDIKLIKVKPFDIEPINNEDDYLLHAEISPINKYICFYNKKNPKYLFFGRPYQSGVFKIIKFMKNILCFKWSTQQDVLIVTFSESPLFYLITKDYYLSYNLEKNYNFNDISWSPSGKEVILVNIENSACLVVALE